MKSTVKNSMKTIAAAAAALVLLAGSPASSFAGTGTDKHKTSHSGPETAVNVQYIGADDKMFEFKVEFENPTAQKFNLTIRNDEGDVVYSKNYNDVHFAKNIKLMKEGNDMENIRPTFAITVGNRLVLRSFKITSSVTSKVEVTKL
jgi:hypothetical protein